MSSSARVDASPVSRPSNHGELAETASSAGSHGRTNSSAAMHASGLSTPTWTWSPQHTWRSAVEPAYSANAR